MVRPSFLFIGFAAALAAFGMTLGKSQAQDVRHACSEKYQAAKAAGTLGDEGWPQFYSRCAAEMKQAQPAAEAAPAPIDIRRLCSQKYQAAKAAGTLGGQSWPQFYSQCTAEAKANPSAAAAPAAPAPGAEAAPAPVPAAPPPAPTVASPPPAPEQQPTAQAAPPPAPAAPVTPANPLRRTAPKPAAPPAAAAPGGPVFPSAIAPQYANEKPAKARIKTCAEQYKANKAANANGGLRWIQKGDGYWPECNRRLKGG